MRTFGTVDHVGDLGLGDHVAWCGDGQSDFDALAASVFGAAAADHRLVYLCEDPAVDRLSALDGVRTLVDSGRLILADSREVYAPFVSAGTDFDPQAQLAEFGDVLAQALAEGYTGVRVVADNTPMVEGDDATLARWRAWEALTDRWQANQPISGICYFDRTRVDPDRLGDMAALHPLLAGVESRLRVYSDGDALCLCGSVEADDDDWLRATLELAADNGGLVIDLARTDYVHHRALLVLVGFTVRGTAIRLRHAPAMVRRQFDLLGLADRVAFD